MGPESSINQGASNEGNGTDGAFSEGNDSGSPQEGVNNSEPTSNL